MRDLLQQFEENEMTRTGNALDHKSADQEDREALIARRMLEPEFPFPSVVTRLRFGPDDIVLHDPDFDDRDDDVG